MTTDPYTFSTICQVGLIIETIIGGLLIKYITKDIL